MKQTPKISTEWAGLDFGVENMKGIMVDVNRNMLLGLLVLITLPSFSPNWMSHLFAGFMDNKPAEELIGLINEFRSASGLPPFRTDPVLMVLAQEHAEYMAATGIITHYGEDGARPYQRAIAAGYPVDGDLTFGGVYSEMILANPDLSPAEVVEIWKADPQDYQTLMSVEFQDIGVGVAFDDAVTYFVLDAGRKGDGSSIPNGGAGITSTPLLGTPSNQIILTSTPEPDGAVYHIVQPGEALWGIALAYGVSIDEIKEYNRLTSDDIFVGQRILILQPEIKGTDTPRPTVTATLGIPISNPRATFPPAPTFTNTPIPLSPTSPRDSTIVVGLIILLALAAAGIGAWLGHGRTG